MTVSSTSTGTSAGTSTRTSTDTTNASSNAPLMLGPCPGDVQITETVRKTLIAEQLLDDDALKSVRRLQKFGHEAYLVGGCIRDILLSEQPKDFDVATSAHPEEVKKIFRNCRLIGRRFRLAHLYFKNKKIIEVATFRREATENDNLENKHDDQNLFGTRADDAIRRDFTINALMYDVSKKEIIDFSDGLKDIETRTLRFIGDAKRRIEEDPVRMIRAVKFSTKLQLSPEPGLMETIEENAPLIQHCSPARLVEELFKILRSGYAAQTLADLQNAKLLVNLMPALAKQYDTLSADPYTTLRRTDSMIRANELVSDALLLCALIYPVLETMLLSSKDISKDVSDQLTLLTRPMRFTKAHKATVRNVLISLRKMSRGPINKRNKRILQRDFAFEALQMLKISGLCSDSIMTQWEKFAARYQLKPTAIAAFPNRRKKKRRPRRAKRLYRNRDGESSEPAPPSETKPNDAPSQQ